MGNVNSEKLRLSYLDGASVSLDNDQISRLLPRKAEALLCYLAVTGHSHPRPVLASLLWGDFPEDRAQTNLRGALAKLRRHIPDHLLITRTELCFNRQQPHRLDVAEFEKAISRVRAITEPDVEQLKLATDLYRGDFLEGFQLRNAAAFEEWALVTRARLREMALSALYQLATALTTQGEYPNAIETTQRLLVLEPWREEAHRQLMLLLARRGHRSAALAQYDTCRQLLREELDIVPSVETEALREAILTEEVTAQGGARPAINVLPDKQTPPQPEIPHDLPYEPTAFIGRQKELALLGRFLGDPQVRLVTILGAGGMGKTRLAIAAIRRLLERLTTQFASASSKDRVRFPDGIRFIPLTTANSIDDMVSSLIQTLNIRSPSDSRTPRQQVLAHLRRKRQLLVLDNFEQLLTNNSTDPRMEDGASFVAQLLSDAPNLSLLITSRERLHLLEEQLMPVQGMAFPKPSVKPVENVVEEERYDAVQLFLERARRVRPDYSPSQGEFGKLIQICQLVEGMPLAIELAASWVETLSPGNIAAEIQYNLDMLKTTIRNLPERHRSMRAAFGASWRLMNQEEREIFVQLSVFQGGFTQEAAKQVALTSEGRGVTLELLTQLVNKSLIRLGQERDRYDLHELMRQFAAEQLEVYGLEKREGNHLNVWDRHSAYYCEAVRRWDINLHTPLQFEALKAFEADLANIQAAWTWAVEHDRVSRIDRTLHDLYDLYVGSGLIKEGFVLFTLASERMKQLVKEAEASKPEGVQARLKRIRASALIGEAGFHFFQGRQLDDDDQLDKARRLLHESEVILNQPMLDTEDTRAAKALMYVIKSFLVRPDWLASRNCLQKSLALYQELNIKYRIAFSHYEIGLVSACEGDHELAREASEKSLNLYRSLGDVSWIASVLRQLAEVARQVHDYDASERYLKECLKITQNAGDYGSLQLASRELGALFISLGRFEEAIDFLKQSIAVGSQYRSRHPHTDMLYKYSWAHLSVAFALKGELHEAERTIIQGLALAEEQEDPVGTAMLFSTQGQISAWTGAYAQARRQAQTALRIVHHPTIWPGIDRPPHCYCVMGWAALAEESYAEAQDLLRKSVEGYKGWVADDENLAWAFAALARTEYGLGYKEAAKRTLLSALEIIVKTRAFVPLLHLVPIIAVVLSEEEESLLKERAVEIYALAKSHPFVAKSKLIEDIAGRHVKAAVASLPTDVVAAAKARGQRLDWWKTAEALLEAFQEHG